MSEVRNLVTYQNQAYEKKGLFLYRGTAALKKGYGMCFDLDYAVAANTGQTASDPWGARGLKEIQVPAAANANRFAGALTQDHVANPLGTPRLVELALPGACAMLAQRVISTAGVGRITCVVDSTAGQGLSGLFAYGGLNGRGSAVPLQTLAANGATNYGTGKLAISNDGGNAVAVYSGATGLTTVTLAGAGTALGYSDAAVDASAYEMTVLEGATAAEGTTRATKGVYPVVQATGATTFTVKGNTGDGALTICLTLKDLLMLAYLEDGPESGLSDYVCGTNGAARQFTLNQGGTTFVCMGGITLSGNSTVNTLADPITIGGLGHGARKVFNVLSTSGGSDYIVTVTSGITSADMSTALATVVLDTAADEVALEWRGNTGVATTGSWYDTLKIAATYT